MIRWPFPWRRRRQEPDVDSRVAVELTRRELHETYRRAEKVHQVTEKAKEQVAINHLAPTFQAAFEMRRRKHP